MLLLILAFAPPALADAGNLVAAQPPTRAHGVRNARALTDGVRAREGGTWNSELSAIFDSSRSFVEYDLGRVTPITAAYLQADNNDEYLISVSEDGQMYEPLWTAPAVQHGGLRERKATALSGSGRYVRVAPRQSDGAYSISELSLFASLPAVFPPAMEVRATGAEMTRVRDQLLPCVLGFFVLLFATSRRSSRGRLLVALLPAAWAVWAVRDAMVMAWPLGGREISMLRAVCGAVAGLAVFRWLWWPRRYPAHAGVVHGVLGVAALVAAATFYNLGRPQFWHHGEERPEFVHSLDMRIYYPSAKYFDELGYDGVYLASAAAYLEDVPGATLKQIGKHEIRDLRTLEMRRLDRVGPEIEAVKERFSPERWQNFKRDMAYFRELMGPMYLRTLNDHGANATPVWMTAALLVFRWAPASQNVLRLGGLLDALLLLSLFVAIWRSFGARAMLIALAVFGATNFYMFGTNWGGSTLRQDWLCYLGFAVCALRARRFALAGVFLGASVMIRAFPIIALAGVVLPLAWWAGEHWLRERKAPRLTDLRREGDAELRVLAGAAGCMVAAFLVSGLVFSFEAWAAWWDKVVALNAGTGTNDVSLKALLAGEGPIGRRKLVYWTAMALCSAVIVLAARRQPLYRAVLLALPLIPVLTNPSNYYLHVLFLLPLLEAEAEAGEPAGARAPRLGDISLPLLGLCVAQYWTVLDNDELRRFQAETALTFVALSFVYFNVLRRQDPLLPEPALAS